MRYILIFFVLCCASALPAHADPMDEIAKKIFEENSDRIKIKPGYRGCTSNGDCTAVLILCRWRAVNTAAKKHVTEVASSVTLECKWPKPPAQSPIARCIDKLCDIPADGKYY